MKVTFIHLPHPYLRQPDAQAPIGLLYLAAILENEGVEVDVKNYSSVLTYEAISDLSKADIYGITATSLEILQANRFSHLIKEKYPNSIVGIGGPGTHSDEFIDWGVIDFICKGEGEQIITNICEDYKNRKLKKIYIGESVDNIDLLPLPARHLLRNKQGGNIFAYNKNYKQGGSTILLTSRGCPYHCSFCSSPFLTNENQGIRFRSPKNVYEEVRHIIKKYGIRQFRVSDDMFTANKKRVLEICDLFSTLDIVWRISTRVKPFDKELAEALYRSGCKEVSFGIESFDNNVLKVLQKKTTAEDNYNALNICDKVGIKTRILFMIRTPGQTAETVPINIKWLERVPYTIVACTNFIPIPGSDIWFNPDKYNIEILNKNLDDYNFYFFGKYGENELKNIIKIKDRSLREFNDESRFFKEYLKSTKKLNLG